MRPNESSTGPAPTVRVPSRSDGLSLVPDRQYPGAARSMNSSQAAAADMTRQQIDAIYASDPNAVSSVEAEPSTAGIHNPAYDPRAATEPATAETKSETQTVTEPKYAYAPEQKPASPTSSLTEKKPADQDPPIILRAKDRFRPEKHQIPAEDLVISNPYDRTHDGTKLQATPEDWKKYHSAWQNYYQQYFHQYYSAHIAQMQSALNSKQTADQPDTSSSSRDEVTTEQAMADIRNSIRSKIADQAKKVRKSRHFMPIAAALSVMLVFAFLQYNRILFSNISAYVVPSSVDANNVIVSPELSSHVGPEPKLIIPKVNIDVPVVWDTRPDHDSQMKAMEEGVAWFGIPGANSKPGQVGNTVISGHSSNDFLERGNYKFVFAPLHRMKLDDMIYINYEGQRYTYKVTAIDVVKPTDVDALRYETDKPMLTLITCTPLGTALNRLLITAEQVLPSPAEAAPAPESGGSSEDSIMPGIQPTVIERVFGR